MEKSIRTSGQPSRLGTRHTTSSELYILTWAFLWMLALQLAICFAKYEALTVNSSIGEKAMNFNQNAPISVFTYDFSDES